MKYEIRKYNKSKLSEFLLSDEFQKADTWPISFQRALSLINNPHLEVDDTILVTAVHKGKLLAYRTVMADRIRNGDKTVKVGWICGTWVRQSYRRKKLATILFHEIQSDWQGRLMYTNYAPASKKVYDKTGAFSEYACHQGGRFYVRCDLAGLLTRRYPILRPFTYFFYLLDRIYNTYVLPFVTEPKMKSRLAYKIEVKTIPDTVDCKALFLKALSFRTEKEMNWIMTFPWVIPESRKNRSLKKKYFFSTVAKPFRQYFCSILKDEKPAAIVMLTLKNKQLKVPYYHSFDGDLSVIADLLFVEAWKSGASHIDIFNEDLVREMKYKTAYFAWWKKQERKYMVSSKIIGEFPSRQNVKVQDGEGDVVFV